jgi:hypothetical protein
VARLRDSEAPAPGVAVFGKRVLVFVLCALATGCSNDKKAAEPVTKALETQHELSPVENSGRKLSGSYIVRGRHDVYLADKSSDSSTRYVFSSDGSFKRERLKNGRLVSAEAGSYLIGARGELVLFVERIGDDSLGSARTERYEISEESSSSIQLKDGSEATVLLEKIAPEPNRLFHRPFLRYDKEVLQR